VVPVAPEKEEQQTPPPIKNNNKKKRFEIKRFRKNIP
jgi:hypothetical protein